MFPRPQFVVKDANVDGIIFKQVGFVVDITSDHALSLTLNSDAVGHSGSALSIPVSVREGSTHVCIPLGAFTVHPDTCFGFDQVGQPYVSMWCGGPESTVW